MTENIYFPIYMIEQNIMDMDTRT